ncbi:MAG: ester cyclase [Candidatus Paceibacterota bacterium]
MKRTLLLLLVLTSQIDAYCQQDSLPLQSQIESNKEIARNFYQNLWFSNNTEKYKEYVAEEYVVHDIFERKDLVEPAIEQKNIADMFWANGELSGKIDYQIAEGDLVATRWHGALEPNTFFGRFLEMEQLAIINVFRIEDGKIVEIWNHRHDIETNQTLRFVLKGLLIGLAIAIIPTFIAFRLRRKLKEIQK